MGLGVGTRSVFGRPEVVTQEFYFVTAKTLSIIMSSKDKKGRDYGFIYGNLWRLYDREWAVCSSYKLI